LYVLTQNTTGRQFDIVSERGIPLLLDSMRAPVHGDQGFRLEGTTVSGGWRPPVPVDGDQGNRAVDGRDERRWV